MAKKSASDSKEAQPTAKPSALVDTRVIYCGDNLDQLRKLPPECVDLIYIDPPFNSNRNVFDFSSDVLHEIHAFLRKSGKSIIGLTVRDIRQPRSTETDVTEGGR